MILDLVNWTIKVTHHEGTVASNSSISNFRMAEAGSPGAWGDVMTGTSKDIET